MSISTPALRGNETSTLAPNRAFGAGKGDDGLVSTYHIPTPWPFTNLTILHFKNAGQLLYGTWRKRERKRE
jgi:hypothetical protein